MPSCRKYTGGVSGLEKKYLWLDVPAGQVPDDNIGVRIKSTVSNLA